MKILMTSLGLVFPACVSAAQPIYIEKSEISDYRLLEKNPEYMIFIKRLPEKGEVEVWYVRPEPDVEGVVSNKHVVTYDCVHNLRTFVKVISLNAEQEEVDVNNLRLEAVPVRDDELREMRFACGRLVLPPANPLRDSIMWYSSIGRGPLGKQGGWRYLTSTSSGTIYKYKYDSIKQRNSTLEIWVKADYSRDKSEKARSAMMLYSFDCTASTSAILSLSEYQADGRLTKSASITPDVATYGLVVPDTIGDAALKAACGAQE